MISIAAFIQNRTTIKDDKMMLGIKKFEIKAVRYICQ